MFGDLGYGYEEPPIQDEGHDQETDSEENEEEEEEEPYNCQGNAQSLITSEVVRKSRMRVYILKTLTKTPKGLMTLQLRESGNRLGKGCQIEGLRPV